MFSPEVVVSTDPFLSILGMYMSAVISDVAFLTVKVCTWKISIIQLSQLMYDLTVQENELGQMQ